MTVFSKIKKFVAGKFNLKFNRILPLSTFPWMEDKGVSYDFRTKDYLELYGQSDYANPTLHGIVKELAMAVANCNLEFYRKEKGGNLRKLRRNHSLVDLFWHINPVTTRFDFWEATIIYLQLAGECPWALEKMSRTGKPRELWALRPDYLKVVPDSQKFVKGYLYETGIGKVGYKPDEIIFLKYFNPLNMWRGQPPFGAARQHLISAYYRSKYHIKFFKQGASPSGVFSSEGTLQEVTYKRLQKELEAAYSGVDNAHRPLLLDGGLKWTQMGLNPKDADFIQQNALDQEAIAGVANVPSNFAFGGNSFRYGNVQTTKEQAKQFWGITIKPLIRKIEEYLNTFLVVRYGTDIFAKFDLSEVDAINDTNMEKSLIASRLVKNGIWSVNDARKELWNMPAVPGGDVRYMPSNAASIDTQGKVQKSMKSNNNGSGKMILEDFDHVRL